jgi:hypothetical protein
LEEGGCYWYLYPRFKALADECGEMIDLYGDAFFEGESLSRLKLVLERALEESQSLPERWRVLTGVREGFPRKELYEDVERAKYVEILRNLLDVVVAAEARGKGVWCFGD